MLPLICHCGAQAGYLHARDCPYPLYTESALALESWQAGRDRIRATICASRPVGEGFNYRYLCQFRDTGKDYFTTDCAFDDWEQAQNYVTYILSQLTSVTEGRVYDRITQTII